MIARKKYEKLKLKVNLVEKKQALRDPKINKS